jgi:spore germination cell wall hydrolase CwlJ-like protein
MKYRNKYPTQEQIRTTIEISFPDMTVMVSGVWPETNKSVDCQSELVQLAQVCYGEARDQPPEGIQAVAQVVLNRWRRRTRYWGYSISKVILDVDGQGRCEFCCMDSSDVNFAKLFNPDPTQWYKVVRAVLPVYLNPEPIGVDSAYFYATEKGAQTPFFKKLRFLEKIGDHLFFTDLHANKQA